MCSSDGKHVSSCRRFDAQSFSVFDCESEYREGFARYSAIACVTTRTCREGSVVHQCFITGSETSFLDAQLHCVNVAGQ